MVRAIIFLFAFLLTSPAWAACPSGYNCYYIRDGGTGDGSAWNNALDDIPNDGTYATLSRGGTNGSIYYFAAGTYYSMGVGKYFSTPVSGSKVIVFRKATIADHGEDTGWDNVYATGQALFKMWEFTTSYWTIDGATGGGPSSWDSGHGFKFTAQLSGSSENHVLHFTESPVTNITIQHSEMVNPFPVQDISGCPGFGSGITSITGITNALIEYNYIHDFFGVMIWTANWSTSIIRYNYFADQTFGANYCHGNVFNESENSHDMDIYGNYIYNCSGGIISVQSDGNCATDPIKYSYNWKFYNNIIEKGTNISCLCDSSNANGCNNFKIYNNTFYDVIDADYFGMYIQRTSTGGNEAKNNIFHTCNTASPYWTNVSHGNNGFYGCSSSGDGGPVVLGDATDTFTDVSGDPPHDFSLAATSNAIDAGTSLGSPYNVDILEVGRPQGNAWDIGAYEYGAGGDTTPPTVTLFDLPLTYASLSVPINYFNCSDNFGVAAYCVTLVNLSAGCATQNAAVPWQAQKPTSITFPYVGIETAFGWCKDAAGNISDSAQDTVDITLPPTNAAPRPVQGGGIYGGGVR